MGEKKYCKDKSLQLYNGRDMNNLCLLYMAWSHAAIGAIECERKRVWQQYSGLLCTLYAYFTPIVLKS